MTTAAENIMYYRSQIISAGLACLLVLGGCSSAGRNYLPDSVSPGPVDYLIGPGDQLQIFIWRNPDLSSTVTVRPDGKISSPLVTELHVAGLKAADISELIKQTLARYIRNPEVSVIVSNFNSTSDQQIRVIGNATKPRTLSYRDGMTLLDVMIEVEGLSEFADGDRAKLIRKSKGKAVSYTIELDSLIRAGDITKNRAVYPGDTIIIPEAWF